MEGTQMTSQQNMRQLAVRIIEAVVEDYLKPPNKFTLKDFPTANDTAKQFLFGMDEWEQSREIWCKLAGIEVSKLKRVKTMTWDDIKKLKRDLAEQLRRVSSSQHGNAKYPKNNRSLILNESITKSPNTPSEI